VKKTRLLEAYLQETEGLNIITHIIQRSIEQKIKVGLQVRFYRKTRGLNTKGRT
jgi:hypothetical protein